MRNICARFPQDLSQCARFAQDRTSFPDAQYMCKICARLYFFLQYVIYAQDLCKIVVISPMCNICARFAQDCTYFLNAQYMRKIVLILQCATYVQDCTTFSNAQDLCKIVLISPMRNICTRCVQDCTFFLYLTYSPRGTSHVSNMNPFN